MWHCARHRPAPARSGLEATHDREERRAVEAYHDLGVQSLYKLDTTKLGDRIQMNTNQANCNLVIQGTDLAIRRRHG